MDITWCVPCLLGFKPSTPPKVPLVDEEDGPHAPLISWETLPLHDFLCLLTPSRHLQVKQNTAFCYMKHFPIKPSHFPETMRPERMLYKYLRCDSFSIWTCSFGFPFVCVFLFCVLSVAFSCTFFPFLRLSVFLLSSLLPSLFWHRRFLKNLGLELTFLNDLSSAVEPNLCPRKTYRH